MFEKASKLDLNCYDDPEYYNRFVLAVSEAENSIERFLTILKNAVQCLTALTSLGIFYFLICLLACGRNFELLFYVA